MGLVSIENGIKTELTADAAAESLNLPKIYTITYTPSGIQTLSDIYAVVSGSTVSYTPRYGSGLSVIVFEYSVMAYAYYDAAEGEYWPATGTIHYVPQRDSVNLGDWKQTEDIGVDQHRRITMSCAVSSWGTTSATLRWTARRYSSLYPVNLFQIAYSDGASSSLLSPAILKITETKL